MRLNRIVLNSFRNYDLVKAIFDNNLIILVGENAQGKTNLLESIYYLATGSAYRPSKDRELINWKKNYFKITADLVTRGDRESTIEIDYANNKKTIKVNGIKKTGIQELLGIFNVVLFSPEDLSLIKGAPGERRTFLNREISQINSQYFYFLSQYGKILLQRNTVLKKYRRERKKIKEMLHIWDNQLVYYGSRVINARKEFILLLNGYAKEKQQIFSGDQENLEIIYRTNGCNPAKDITLDEIGREFNRRLQQGVDEDLVKGMTITGPQRDDLTFLINKKEIKIFGSQGQQRSAVLSVKLAQINLIKDKTGYFPVLLLDDVLSELDQHRRKFLLQQTKKNIQTFITTTHLDLFTRQVLDEAQVINVAGGKLAGAN